MGRVSGQLKSSANAGQLSESLRGKVGLKQYYSGAKTMRGFEPVLQSGFKLSPGSRLLGVGTAGTCMHGVLKVSVSLSYTIILTAGQAEIWRNDGLLRATVPLPSITADMLPDLSFYGEADTFGIFHPDLWNGIRLLRNSADDTSWSVSAWPYGTLPSVDLGGTYTKTPDVWSMYVSWTTDTENIELTPKLEGLTPNSVRLCFYGGTTQVNPNSAGDADWAWFSSNLQATLAAVPGFDSGVTVLLTGNYTKRKAFTITFGGVLAGSQYDFQASVTSTSTAAALVSHTQTGKTSGEALISAARGGFAGCGNFQDRQVYYAPKAQPAAVAMSRTGEYFDLNIEGADSAGARLEKMRTEVSETVYHVIDATYLLAFTDRAEYFASNRTIEAGKPLNWVRASEVGSRKNCKPVLLGDAVYFVSKDGGILYRATYDAVSEGFKPDQVNDFNNDIVSGVVKLRAQKKRAGMKADRLWILRADGRLLHGLVNVAQEIPLAVSEWHAHDGGLVRAISVDGQDNVWISVERNGVFTREMIEESDVNLFQKTIDVTTDAAGVASGLGQLEGKTVWAEMKNDVYGPYVVSGGKIATPEATTVARIGLWEAPVYEGMPFVKVLPNDEVVRRRGKVSWARIYVQDAASMAVGGNGQRAKDISFHRMSDDLAADKQNYTGHVNVVGIKGAAMDPTMVITQVRPGRLTVRDFIPGVKL